MSPRAESASAADSPPDVAEIRTDLDRLVTLGKGAMWVAGIFALPVVVAALLLWKNDGRQDDRITRLETSAVAGDAKLDKIMEKLDSLKVSVTRLEAKP